ncbi:hypothetical protein LH29_18085 [Draconibacterium sediminis]|uniref:Uncharacterized protein n=1 Tax=Draconibacterium sediminis TaxID=1544798 RepID=A0A0D8J7H6_9BACT|nr:hypothetical protein LH29_18085 [Draconibacterium sediminis]
MGKPLKPLPGKIKTFQVPYQKAEHNIYEFEYERINSSKFIDKIIIYFVFVFFMLEKTYICNAFGIHPILCVWGLTFRKETVESPSFFLYLSANTATPQPFSLS